MGRKLIFLTFQGNSGSYKLRALEIANKLKTYHKINSELYCKNVENIIPKIKNAIIIIIKLPDQKEIKYIDQLRKQNNRLILDLCDLQVLYSKFLTWNKRYTRIFFSKYDHFIVMNKYMQHFLIKRKVGEDKISVIYHHWDERLRNHIKKLSDNKLRIYYIGITNKEGKNCLYLDHFKSNIQVITGTNIKGAIHYKNTCHYSIRDPNTAHALFKSNIKLSNASASDANIIISPDQSVMDLLPHDYPYLVANPTKNNVAKMIDYVKKTYNTDIWKKGLTQMNIIKEKTDLNNIIKDYIKLLGRFKIR